VRSRTQLEVEFPSGIVHLSSFRRILGVGRTSTPGFLRFLQLCCSLAAEQDEPGGEATELIFSHGGRTQNIISEAVASANLRSGAPLPVLHPQAVGPIHGHILEIRAKPTHRVGTSVILSEL
jgi:hypothetical protein